MMGTPLRLENFDTHDPSAPASAEAATEGEGKRLAAFEEGYKAGWDDAAASQTELQTTVSSDLASHLQELAFTFHEAKAHVLKSLDPMLREVLGQLLPAVAREAWPALVAEHVRTLAEEAAGNPIILTVAPQSREALLSVLPEDPGFPLRVRDEPTLAEGQVFLRFGEREIEIDTTRTVNEVLAGVDEFFNANDERIAAHG